MINSLQQIGIGVASIDTRWPWYRKAFGMNVPIFDEAAKAPLMTRYTGGTVHSRRAVLALNMAGGAGFEIWQYTSRAPEPPAFDPGIGDTGLLAARLHCSDVEAAKAALSRAGVPAAETVDCGPGGSAPEAGGGQAYYEALPDPRGTEHLFVRDPAGLWFDLVPSRHRFKKSGTGPIGGLAGALIGVSEIERSLEFYRDVLGFDRVVYDRIGTFPDFAVLPEGKRSMRRVLLERSAPATGPFGELLGPPTIELVQSLEGRKRRIFEDRYWGDLGFIHLCFDICGTEQLKRRCEEGGFFFTVDSDGTFDMGEAAGRFAYVEDPDGTLIEFVETHRIPVLKKIGWYLNLKKRANRRLPGPLIRLLGLAKVRD